MNLAAQSKKQSMAKIESKNFTCAHAGKFADLDQYLVEHPLRPKPLPGKLFIKDHVGATSMQVSLNKLPAGASVPFYHAHKHNEELYIFTGGQGQMQVDGQIFDVSEGSVVRIAPGGFRAWRNTGSEPLYYLVIQAKDGSLDQDTFDDGIPAEDPVIWA